MQRLHAIFVSVMLLCPFFAYAQGGSPGVPIEALPDEVETAVVLALQDRGLVTSTDVPTETAIRAAVVRLQEVRGLAPTGWIDEETLALLGLGELEPGPTPEDLPGSASFHRHEAERLQRTAIELRQRAEMAGTPAARERLLAAAARAREVARLHGIGSVDEALPPVGGPAPGAEEPPPAVLGEDLTRDEVLALQQALRARGLLDAPPSGVLDTATRQAISAWQLQQGRAATGHPDVRTMDELVGAGTAAAPAP